MQVLEVSYLCISPDNRTSNPVIQIISIVIGAVIIITVVEHYFSGSCRTAKQKNINSHLIIPVFIVVIISFGYLYFTTFYRASATEAKRLGGVSGYSLYFSIAIDLKP